MKIEGEAMLVRIFVGEDDQKNGRPLFEVIVEEARRRNMAGATVIRGIMGFGADSRLHSTKILQLSEDLPMVVEIVDKEERIRDFLPFLDEVVEEGLVTLEKVHVVAYRHKESNKSL